MPEPAKPKGTLGSLRHFLDEAVQSLAKIEVLAREAKLDGLEHDAARASTVLGTYLLEIGRDVDVHEKIFAILRREYPELMREAEEAVAIELRKAKKGRRRGHKG